MSITFFTATAADLAVYCLLRKSPAILRVAKICLIAASIVMFALDIFAIWHYQTPFNIIMLEVALMTNLREGSEFLIDYLLDWHFLAFVMGVLLVLIVLRLIFSLIQRRKSFLAAIIILAALIGALGTARQFIKGAQTNLLPDSFAPSRIYVMASRLYSSQKAYDNMLRSSPSDITITAKKHSIPNVVFVLGESTNRNHLQLYGYSLPTNPRLSARNDIHVFTDTVSPHAHTNSVLKELFTFCRYGSSGEWFTYTTLLRILSAAGYHTMWLSNQESPSSGSVIRLLSGQCDAYRFTENMRAMYDNGGAYDDRLLTFIDEADVTGRTENFFLVHLLGTHMRYSKRYPQEYAFFTADDEGGFDGISRSQKKLRAEYDNAVLYNDYVVDGIISRFEDKSAIVIYVSDHGEEVYDDMNFWGHSEGTLNRNMIEVPFLIWTSPKFRQEFPELEARIASSVNRPYMTDDMIHTVLDIMGIETPGYDPSKSVINPAFDSSRKRIYAGMLYDKELGLHALQ